MKLPVSLLNKFIDLPFSDTQELRHILDDLGLEVKDQQGEGQNTVFNIETLANRGDHIHALGVARELSARFLSPLKLPAVVTDLSDRKTSIPVRNLTDKCLRYALLEMTLPEDMQNRPEVINALGESAGKHPIVDFLNYILMEIGQPMHAFDRDKVEGEVTIEISEQPEKIIALDNKEYSVPKGSILIKDKKKIIAVAGVIGCANSMVTPETRKVLIESATFDPVSVRKTAKAMAISTDASFAFERGADIESVVQGLKRLAYLTGVSAGGQQKGAHVVGWSLLEGPALPKVTLDFDILKVRKHLNLPRLDPVEITARLKNLGFTFQTGENEKILKISVPSWRRWDIHDSEDLTEEVVRVLSYSKVKLELPELDYVIPEPNNIEELLSHVEPVLIGNGFHEVITKGFYSQAEVKLLSEVDKNLTGQHLSIKNAVDSAYSHMKVTNIIHLARLAEQNHRRGVHSVKVYEIGRLFNLNKEKNRTYEFEFDVLTLAVSGRWNEHEWQKAENKEQMLASFKGIIESLIRSLGQDLVLSESSESLLHPGVQAAIKLGRTKVGFFGLVHPALKTKLDLKNDLLYAQFDAEELAKHIQSREYVDSSEFPAVRRDLTMKIAINSRASKVSDYIEDLNPENLVQVSIVDNFKKNEEDFRRVTFRVTFQRMDRTLESSEVDLAMQNIITTLQEKHKVELCT